LYALLFKNEFCIVDGFYLEMTHSVQFST